MTASYRWTALQRRLRSSLLLLLLVPQVSAEPWAQWRGPTFNGASPETNLPARWSKTENVAWVTPLPGRSGATPVVWGNHLFVTSPDEQKKLHLLCLEAATGKVRWQRQVAAGDRGVGKNNMASPSPITDGRNVYALFGTGDFAAFDLEGKPVWQLQLWHVFGAFANMFLYGASPVLHDGKLYVPILQRNPPTYGHAKDQKTDRQSWLVCIDPATGKILWQHARQTDAPEEAMEAYTTPLPYAGPKGVELIVVGADCVTAHRPSDGAEIWRYAGLNQRKNPGGRIVPSPVAAPGFLYACGPKREKLVALRHGAAGIVDDAQVAWRTDQYVPDVCTPLYYRDRLFVLDGDRQVMNCYEPKTGASVWQGRLGVREIFSASPTGADGRIYCFSEEGTVVVLSAGATFEILATIPMGEGPCRSSVVPADGRLFLRTASNLYCVQAPK